jgi:hypothetical protein
MPSGVNGVTMAPLQPKVLSPRLLPGVVQRCQSAGGWLHRADIAAFPHVAAQARVSQVGFDGQPAVLAADDMIDLMWGEGIVFAEETILALMEGAPSHQVAEGVADVTRQNRYGGGRELWP